jgi:hypothetical protein
MGERRKAVFIRCKPPYQWYAQHYIEQPNASNVPPLRICVEHEIPATPITTAQTGLIVI